MVSFEPALDYVVVKIPNWPFEKFASSNRDIGTQMKATGEVLGIADSFGLAFWKSQKSVTPLPTGGTVLITVSKREHLAAVNTPIWKKASKYDDFLYP